MVNLSLKTQTSRSASEPSAAEPANAYNEWLDVETTWIEGKAGCPHCGKGLKIACDKDISTLHIQKDEE